MGHSGLPRDGSNSLPSFCLENRSTQSLSPFFTEIFLQNPPSLFIFPKTTWDSRILFTASKKLCLLLCYCVTAGFDKIRDLFYVLN